MKFYAGDLVIIKTPENINARYRNEIGTIYHIRESRMWPLHLLLSENRQDIFNFDEVELYLPTVEII